MNLEATLREQILLKLVEVIDPETGVDVLRMHLVEDLEVDDVTGTVSYRFRPSSALCPLALSLALDIKHAIASIPGVQQQHIAVGNYVRAEELTQIINRDEA
ncbi:MAG: iron-sulfur cluster assembly protein [Anaerolineae bacterium]|jgi:metal-sulfur cluster biosynthetic enzyme|nr:iron-sulfur cluster assembly protein [Anaerolineae bacterium]